MRICVRPNCVLSEAVCIQDYQNHSTPATTTAASSTAVTFTAAAHRCCCHTGYCSTGVISSTRRSSWRLLLLWLHWRDFLDAWFVVAAVVAVAPPCWCLLLLLRGGCGTLWWLPQWLSPPLLCMVCLFCGIFPSSPRLSSGNTGSRCFNCLLCYSVAVTEVF